MISFFIFSNNFTLFQIISFFDQRLEFLGDTVLNFVVSAHLYRFFPGHHEGHLSLLRSSLADLAARLQAQPSAAEVFGPSSPAQLWLEEAGHLDAPQPLLLAIGQQCQDLQQLLHSRSLLQASMQPRLESSR